jgi:ClpX C4-type zinc finger
MYYEILINGKSIGVFGHEDVESIHLSLLGDTKGICVFASAVCAEGKERVFYDWIQQEIGPDDKVGIVPTKRSDVPEPRKKYVMGQPKQRVPSDDVICDFCQRKETEVSKMIHIDEHRPTICSDCVDMCNAILCEQA